MLTASAVVTTTAPVSTTGIRHDRVHAPTTKANANHGPPASETADPRGRSLVTSASTPRTTAPRSPLRIASSNAEPGARIAVPLTTIASPVLDVGPHRRRRLQAPGRSPAAATAGDNEGMSPRRLFRTVAIAEAITWALLLTGMFLKDVTETTELGVRVGGMLHGVVFVAYVVVTVVVAID